MTRPPRGMLGKTLSASGARSKRAVTVVGIKRRHQDFIHARDGSAVQPGDLLIGAGKTRDVERFAARV